MATFEQKVSISLGSAAMFALVNWPTTYGFTSGLTGLDLVEMGTGCPTYLGKIVHALVFFVGTFLSMGDPYQNTGVKLKHTTYGSLIFYLVSSTAMFALVGSIMGSAYADVNGCPTVAGVLLHTVVYFALLVAVMYLPERNK